MNKKNASLIWLCLAVLCIEIFSFQSIHKLVALEKIGIAIFDALYFVSFYKFLSGNKTEKKKWALLIFSIVPVIYLTFSFNFNLLREPSLWITLLKSVIQTYLIYVVQQERGGVSEFQEKITYAIPLFIVIGLNLFYILSDTSAPSWDTARHATDCLKVFDLLLSGNGLVDTWMFYDFYPSLGYILTIPFQLLFGRSYDALVLSMLLLWFPLAYHFSLKIFREVFNIDNGYESFINFAFHSNVMLLSLMKQFLMDYQMFAMLLVQFYILYKTDKFNKVKHLILTGVMCGVGFMVKESYLVYSLLLIASYLFWIAKDEILNPQVDKWIFLYLKVALVCLILAFIVVPWFTGWSYMFNWEMKGAGSYTTSGKAEGDPYPFSMASFIWYFKALNYYYTWPILVVLIVGWVYSFRKPELRNMSLVHISALGVTWLIFTMLWNKDFRYLLPAVAFFIPAYVGLAKIGKQNSVILISFVTLFSLYVNFAQAFSVGLHFPSINIEPYAKDHNGNNYIDTPLSVAVVCSILQKQGVSSFDFDCKNQNQYDEFARDFYLNQLKISNISFVKPSDSTLVKKEVFSLNDNTLYGYFDKYDSSEYVLFRDSIYSSYSLYKFSRAENATRIEEIGHYGRLTGDIKFIVEAQEKTDTTAFHKLMDLKVKSSTNLTVKVIIYHTYLRWPLIYRQQFTGEIPYTYDLSLHPYPMIPLRSATSKNQFVLN